MQRVALQMRVVLLLLDALSHGFLIAEREVTGGRFALFLRFSAFQGDEFLHGGKWIEGSEKTAGDLWCNSKVVEPTPSPATAQRRFSVRGSITPRRNNVTCPVLDDTTIEIQ